MENYSKFNLNDKVKVKIKEAGYEYLAKQEAELLKHLNVQIRTAEDYKNQADSDGYSRMQIWEMLDSFGGTHMKIQDYIEMDILIEQKP